MKNHDMKLWEYQLCRIAISVMFISIGLIISLLHGNVFVQIINSLNWEKVPCKINTSEIQESIRKRNKLYSLKLSYSYEVDNTIHNGDRLNFAWTDSMFSYRIKYLKKKYPVGKETFCYVNPAHPGQSVINRFSENLILSFLAIIGLFLGIIGILAEIYVFFRDLSKANEQFMKNINDN